MIHIRSRRAFTLIELLIVVAIIAILAAIAVPNFLEAQTRAKISRVNAELRTFATAIETYRLDYSKYPRSLPGAKGEELVCLTTPVSYLNTFPRDTFKLQMRSNDDPNKFDGYIYDYVMSKWHPGTKGSDAPMLKGNNTPIPNCTRIECPVNIWDASFSWFMFSIGPDLDEEYNYINMGGNVRLPMTMIGRSYDATNGTLSSGDIYHAGARMF